MSRARLALTLVPFLASPPLAAAGGTLTDQAVSLTYGASHWDASPEADFRGTETLPLADAVYQTGWWYRVVGVDTQEHPLPPPDSEVWGTTSASFEWSNVDGKGFALSERLAVFDLERPAGAFTSSLDALNLTSGELQVRLFHYLDADAGGTAAGDTGELLAPRVLSFVDGDSLGIYRGWGIAHHQVGAAPTIQSLLNDGLPTEFDDSGTLFGPGNWSAAWQWNVTMAPGSSAQQYIQVKVSSHLPRCTTKGDLDGDGAADLSFWRRDTGRRQLWSMRRTHRAGQVLWDAPGDPVATDDFLGDCAQAVVALDAGGQVRFQEFNGPGGLLTGAVPLASNWKIAATADFNRDGHPDILWRNSDSQRLVVWKMGEGGAPGTRKTGNLTPSPDHAVDANWEVVAAADYDGDGNVDLAWYNPASGRAVIWYLDAALVRVTGAFTTPASAADANWRIVASADFGKGASASWGTPDLLWLNTTSGKLVVWHMNWSGARASGLFTSPDTAGSPWEVFGPR